VLAARDAKEARVPEQSAKPARLATIRRLRKEYASRDGATVVALDDVTLDIDEGQFITVVGPSGCGKSTLLHIIAGVLARTSGELLLRGTPIEGPRQEIGVAFQEPLLLPWRTVIDNVLLPIEVHRKPF
jgi:NitT/TauT family transport system ATP-binding protein